MADAIETIDPFDPPISSDPDTIRLEQEETMRLLRPEWQPIRGKLDTQLLAVAAETSAETRQAAADRLRSEVMSLVGSLFGLERLPGLPARSTVLITAADAAGHTLPAGETVWVGDIECVLSDDFEIPASDTTGVAAIECVDIGADVNGATAPLELDGADWIEAAELTGPLAGGADEESDAAYAVRLREDLQLISDTIILPSDGVVALRRHPAVGWCIALKGYDAPTDTQDVARTATYVVADLAGQPLGSTVLDALQTTLEAKRETNWSLHVVSPQYTPIDVTAEIEIRPEWPDPAGVVAATEAALASRLSPAGHLTPPYGGLDPSWVPSPRIHVNELIAVAAAADGVLRVTSLEIGDGSAAYLDLASPRHLPTVGELAVTEAS